MMVDETSMLHVAIQNLVVEVRNTNDKVDGLTKEMSILISNQKEIKELRDSLGRVFKRVESIEHHQSNDGCPAHKNFVKVREEQLKGYDKLAIDCKEMYNKLLVRIETIEEKPKKRIETAIIEVIKWVTVFIIGAIALKLGVTK